MNPVKDQVALTVIPGHPSVIPDLIGNLDPPVKPEDDTRGEALAG